MPLTALQKIRQRANQLKKAHSKMTDRDAIMKASAEYRAGKISGVRKKKAVGTKPKAKKVGSVRKAAAPKKKTVIKTERLTTIGKASAKKTTGGAIAKGTGIIRKMDSLKKKVESAKNKDERDFYKAAYNAEFDKLAAVKKQMRA